MTFPGFHPPSTKPLSAGARRTAKQQRAIAAGAHPFGRELANNGKTCGQCWHAVAVEGRESSKRYWKCEIGRLSHSAASDLRLSWPACVRFTTAQPEGFEPIAPKWVTRAAKETTNGKG